MKTFLKVLVVIAVIQGVLIGLFLSLKHWVFNYRNNITDLYIDDKLHI